MNADTIGRPHGNCGHTGFAECAIGVFSGIIQEKNHIKSDGLLAQYRHPFSTRVRGTDTMSHSIPNPTEQSNIPYGYCYCGCGQLAPRAKQTDNKRGIVQGEPIRFIRGHNSSAAPRPPFVEPTLQPGTRAIQLTKNKVAIVDAADYEWLMQWKWYVNKHRNTFYAMRKTPTVNGKRGAVGMHQVLAGKGCDHKDGNGLNNTRNNLRQASVQQNNCNQQLRKDSTSGYKGVSWHKRSKKWQAKITFNSKDRYLGMFDVAEDAARAYDVAALELFGEFARRNGVGE